MSVILQTDLLTEASRWSDLSFPVFSQTLRLCYIMLGLQRLSFLLTSYINILHLHNYA